MDIRTVIHLSLALCGCQLLVSVQSMNCNRFEPLNACFWSSDRSMSPVRSSLDCAIACSLSDSCAVSSLHAPSTCKLVNERSASSAAVVRGKYCETKIKIQKKNEIINAYCPRSLLFSADFLAVEPIKQQTLRDLLCYPPCMKAVESAQEFDFVRLNSTIVKTLPTRCLLLKASEYFGNEYSVAQPIAVSTSWQLQFKEESLCTNSIITNVPRVKNASWAQPLQLDICALACLWRPSCEFFVFNSTGCFEGSLSLYLNSRLLGIKGCIIRHKLRSWANSAVAFYTFNSSWLNLINESVMPAMRGNKQLIEVFGNGFQVPQGLLDFVRIDLTYFELDNRIRTQAPMTFVVGFSRQILHYRSQVLLFANCNNASMYNGDISERTDRNEFWFLNSLTGNWQTYYVHSNLTYNLPEGDMIRLAVAVNGTGGYFVVNGVRAETIMYTSPSTYGTSESDIACLYLGHRPISMPFSTPMNGRIQLLGIFSEMLSVEQINELF